MIEIFEIREAALGGGWYNCYKLKLLASAWSAANGDKFAYAEEEPVFVAVFNVLEMGVSSAAERMLAPGDRIKAWDYTDCSGIARKMGMPLTPGVRMVRAKEGSGAKIESIECNLIANDGVTEIEEGLGSGVEVYCPISMHDWDFELNMASPYIHQYDYLFAQCIKGKWRCATVFSPLKYCPNE